MDRWLPFFHHHVKALTDTAAEGGAGQQTLYMPLRDYLHRYYRGLFWEVELMLPVATQAWFRALFGWLLPPTVKHLKMLQTEELFETLNRDHIVQDVLVPIDTLASTLHRCAALFEIYPLWIVLHRAPEDNDMMRPSPHDRHALFADVGVWGVPGRVLAGKWPDFDGEERTRQLEQHLRDVTGVQTLYATTFQDETQFRTMFDLTHHDRMRKKYNADMAFPTVFEKVRLRR